MKPLTLDALKTEATDFLKIMNQKSIPELFGITDGKAVGTYVEHAFHIYLQQQFDYIRGSSANGIDFPQLEVDLKVTSIRQPQSSCPFRSASQKVYGLGYHLLVLVYNKKDYPDLKSSQLDFQHAMFIHRDYTGDYQTSRGLLNILAQNANVDDVIAFLEDRNLPLDEIGREELARRILQEPPKEGYLTISNVLQWRLQYSRAVSLSNVNVQGIENLLQETRQ